MAQTMMIYLTDTKGICSILGVVGEGRGALKRYEVLSEKGIYFKSDNIMSTKLVRLLTKDC